MKLLAGSALLREAVMRSLKSRPTSFPLTRICRCSAFLIAKASKGAASSSKMPTGCRILGRGACFLKHHCREGTFFQCLKGFLIPNQGWVSRCSSASQDHNGVTWCKGKGIEGGFLATQPITSKLIWK